MTLSESLLWSLSRSVIIASLSIWPAVELIRQIQAQSRPQLRRILLLLAFLPFFVPELLIGFHYRLTATQLSSGAAPPVAALCTELLYALLLFARCVSVGVIVSMLFPGSEVPQSALHSWRMLRETMPARRWRSGWLQLHLAGPWKWRLAGWSIMSLTAFQEFEIAALMQIDRHPIAWTVWLFDAHAARQPLSDSLRMIIGPGLCQFLLLVPLLVLLPRGRTTAGRGITRDGIQVSVDAFQRSRGKSWSVIWLLPGSVMFVVWPFVTNANTTIRGLWSMLINGNVFVQSARQIVTSAAFAAASTILAVNIVVSLRGFRLRNPWAMAALNLLVLLPGLMGSLVVSLLLLAVFQYAWLRWAYETWLPMLLGQMFIILPKAMAVVMLLTQNSDLWAKHGARLLARSRDRVQRTQAARLLWQLIESRWLLGCLLIAHWCFWDVTAASILRPVQLEPVVTRLYNEMHYGRTEALMSLAVLAALLPAMVWFVAMAFSCVWSEYRCKRS